MSNSTRMNSIILTKQINTFESTKISIRHQSMYWISKRPIKSLTISIYPFKTNPNQRSKISGVNVLPLVPISILLRYPNPQIQLTFASLLIKTIKNPTIKNTMKY